MGRSLFNSRPAFISILITERDFRTLTFFVPSFEIRTLAAIHTYRAKNILIGVPSRV
jgi:hypothetical protein